MSTAAIIWIKDGKNYKGTYNHWDSYLACLGKALILNYDTEQKVKELLTRSYYSAITADFLDYSKNQDIDFRRATNLKATLQQSYNYLWKNGKWFYAMRRGKYKELTASKVGL